MLRLRERREGVALPQYGSRLTRHADALGQSGEPVQGQAPVIRPLQAGPQGQVVVPGSGGQAGEMLWTHLAWSPQRLLRERWP